MSKIYVGARAQNMDIGADVANITRVNLVVDSDHMYTAGDDTGRTMEVECPWGTQAMANSILANVRGVQYRPYTAERALLDPAFEPGDAVTVGGLYSQIASADFTYNGAGLVTIGAPDLDEIDDEYPAQQTQSSSIKRQLAYTRSLITKTSEQIRLEVQGVENEISYIQLDLDKITSRVEDAEGNISTLEQTAQSLRSEINGKIDGDYAQTLIDQTLEGITLSVSSSGGSTTFKLTADGVTLSSKTIDLTVDAVNISGTLTARALIGRTVGLLTSAEDEAGGIDITGSSSSTYAIELWSNGALRLVAENGAVYLEDGDGAHLSLYGAATLQGDGGAYFEASDQAWVQGHLLPVYKEAYYCGNANFPWLRMYTTALYVDGEQVTSDRNKKHDIVYDLSGYDAFFDALRAAIFKMNNDPEERNNLGLIAQDVEELAAMFGMTEKECGLVVRETDENGEEHYYLRYLGFIGLLIDQVQKLKARVATLEGNTNEV